MKIAIIGAGNMGCSIARGLAKGSLISDSDIIVSNPSAGKLERLKKEFPSISTTNNNAEAATGADTVSYTHLDVYKRQVHVVREQAVRWHGNRQQSIFPYSQGLQSNHHPD